MKSIAIIGGTGDLGLGRAARRSMSYRVTIGSRDATKALAVASTATGLSGATVLGEENGAAADRSEIAILAIPDLPSDDLLASLKPRLAGKLVISPIVPMIFRDGLFAPSLETGSAAEKVASLLGTRVAGAFHTVPAARLLEVHTELEYDVLVTAETKEVYAETAEVVASVPKLRPLYAGPLRNSRMVEGMTPSLLNVGKLNKIRSPSIRIV
jgi:NADPH-dependent F420 reductase